MPARETPLSSWLARALSAQVLAINGESNPPWARAARDDWRRSEICSLAIVVKRAVIDDIQIAPLDRRMGRKPLDQPRTWSGTVGRHWVRLRRKLFATQAEFAAALTRNGFKVTTPTVSEWERGFRMPNLADLPAIAATLGVPVQSLIPSKAFLDRFCDGQK